HRVDLEADPLDVGTQAIEVEAVHPGRILAKDLSGDLGTDAGMTDEVGDLGGRPREDGLEVGIVDAEHGVVAADGEAVVVGARPSQLLHWYLVDREGRDTGDAVVRPVVA